MMQIVLGCIISFPCVYTCALIYFLATNSIQACQKQCVCGILLIILLVEFNWNWYAIYMATNFALLTSTTFFYNQPLFCNCDSSGCALLYG
jgi:hypothetical protein